MAQVKLSCPYGISCRQLCSSAFHTGKGQWITSVAPSPSCWLLTMNRLVMKAVWANSSAAVYAIFSVLSPVCGFKGCDGQRLPLLWKAIKISPVLRSSARSIWMQLALLWKPYLQYLLLVWRVGRRRKRRHSSPAAKPHYPACPTSHGCPAPGPSHKQALPWGEVMKGNETRAQCCEGWSKPLAAGAAPEAAVALQVGCQWQQLLHNAQCSTSAPFLKLMLNEEFSHVHVTSFTAWCTFLQKMPVTMLAAIAKTLL